MKNSLKGFAKIFAPSIIRSPLRGLSCLIKNIIRAGKQRIYRFIALKQFRNHYPSLISLSAPVVLPCHNERLLNLAVISAYCGTTKNATFNACPVNSIYPHYFASNNEDVLAYAVKLGYIPIYLDVEISTDPILSCYQAKAPKVIPHTFTSLADYDYLLWKDDKISINTSRIYDYIMLMNENNSAMAVRPHPFLCGNILFEFAEAMQQDRYSRQRHKYIAYLTDEFQRGARLSCPLYWCSAILRDMRHPEIAVINDLWWEHMNRCGIEDQLSFDIIAQKFLSITHLPSDLC